MTQLATPSLSDLLSSRLAANSGFDERRDYIGMSKAGDCQRRIYLEYVNGVRATSTAHVGSWLGYTIEAAVLRLLEGEVKAGRELSAFGGRVCGHTDGEWDGDLIEIKSSTDEKVERIARERRCPSRHYQQVNAYMHFGGWKRCQIIYVPRDFGTHLIWTVQYSPQVGQKIESRLSAVVAAVDAKCPPPCECGRCTD